VKQANTVKVSDIKKQLISAIESIGGISSTDSVEEGEEDIDIPVPTFGDDSDSDEDIKVDVKSNNNTNGKVVPGIDNVTIGKPVDLNDPFNDRFVDVADDEKLSLKEFAVLAFKLQEDDSFNVVQPNADD
jgi:hypothetical protein